MVKITLKNPGELDGLLSAADYEKFVAEEGGTTESGRQAFEPSSLAKAHRAWSPERQREGWV